MFSVITALWAQDADDSDRGLVEWSPKNVSWREIYKYKTVPNFPKDPSRKAFFDKIMSQFSRPTEKQITRVGNDRYEKVTWENGRITECWYVGGILVYQTLNMKPDSYYEESAESNAYFNVPQDFLDLRWITKTNFEKTEIYINGPVLVYSMKYAFAPEQGYIVPEGASSTSNVATTSMRIAKIDKKTHFPAYYQDGNMTCEYTFNSSPPAALIIPEKIKELAKLSKRS